MDQIVGLENVGPCEMKDQIICMHLGIFCPCNLVRHFPGLASLVARKNSLRHFMIFVFIVIGVCMCFLGLHQISALAPANPAIFPKSGKSGSGQISSRIWQTPVQLQCVQLISHKNQRS